MEPIYFDHAATTRVLPEAAQAALRAMTEDYGNPSSLYALGTRAAKALAAHREAVAQALGCQAGEVIFTSGGTEGDNWAISLAAHLGRHRGKHIITTAVEHAAVLEPCKALEAQGYQVTYLTPGPDGRVKVADLEAALRPDTVLVSMMLVNNETGAIQPVKEAGQVLRRCRSQALLHTDAIQGFLKIPFTPKALGVDLLTVSGHKIGAMTGSGALYLRAGLRAVPLLRGGRAGEGPALRHGTHPPDRRPGCRLHPGQGGAGGPPDLSYPPEDLRLGGLPEGGAGAGGGGRRGCPPHLRHLPARVPQPGGGALAQ